MCWNRLLILNHVDSLNVKNQDMLYTLFQLTFAFPNGQLSLIAVGNIVDFVDRYLPRLSNRSFKPAVVSFPSYGAQDLIRILEGRLSKVSKLQALGYRIHYATLNETFIFCSFR